MPCQPWVVCIPHGAAVLPCPCSGSSRQAVQGGEPMRALAVTTSPTLGTVCCAPRLVTATTGLCGDSQNCHSDPRPLMAGMDS